jgi:hypothetical protein
MREKKLAFAVLICIAFTSTAQKHQKKHQNPEFTIEQQSRLAVKKMTIALDLTKPQQEKMYPLLLVISTNKQNRMEEIGANESKRPELSSDELYAKRIKQMDQQISYQSRVKDVLNKDQYAQWHKIQAHKHKGNNHQGSNHKKGNHKAKK